MAVALPFTFVNGTVIDAGQVNANFQTLATNVDTRDYKRIIVYNPPYVPGTPMAIVTSLTLEPGDWGVQGSCYYNAGGFATPEIVWCGCYINVGGVSTWGPGSIDQSMLFQGAMDNTVITPMVIANVTVNTVVDLRIGLAASPSSSVYDVTLSARRFGDHRPYAISAIQPQYEIEAAQRRERAMEQRRR